jgi:PD-(D/E)XK nuclease superfamily
MDIIPTAKKNIIFDATVLSSLMGCGRFTDIRFNHRLISTKGKSNSLEVGSLIHKVLEVYYAHLINGFPRNTAIGNALTAGQLYITGCQHCAGQAGGTPSCGHEPDEYSGMMNTPEQNDKFIVGWRFALQTCEQYFEYYKNDSWVPLAAEEVIGEVIYEDDEIRVLWKAKIDLRVDTNQIGIVSMDHKTFKQRREKSTLSNQFSGHCVLLKSRNVIVNKIGLQTSLKIDERLTREVVPFTADRLLEWQSEIVPYYAYKYIQFAESGYWPPNYSHCDSVFGPCPYKQVCEGDRGMREEILRNEYQLAPLWDPRNKEVD